MTVEFDLTEDDLVRFAEHYAQTSRVMRCLERFLQIVPALGLFAGFSYAYRATPLRALLLGGVTAVIFLILGRFLGPSVFRGIMRQSLKEGSTSSIVGHHVLTIDEAGMSCRSPLSEGRILWTAVSRVEDTASYLYIHMLPGSGLVVPKRAFPNEAASNAFASRVRELNGSGV